MKIMPEDVTIRLRGKTITLTGEMRAAVLAEMPEIAWIENEDLRTKVLNAWAGALASSGLARIGDLRPSGTYDSAPLRRGTQADHIRSVARLAVKMADELKQTFPDLAFDRDVLIAGALCHDIGKVWELDPANVERWRNDPAKVGLPSIRHPGFGVHICLTVELPEGVAHIAGAHSAEGELLSSRSIEGTIVRWADHSFWLILEKGNQLAEAGS
jgi:putative nucleotidyltransferase with HDIG domain